MRTVFSFKLKGMIYAMISFGQRLRLLRKEAQLTQAELAEQLMVSVQSVSKWECDNSMPDICQIVPIASVLGVSTDCLLGVGGNEKEDREKLYETIGKIKYTYIYLTYEDNCAYKQYEEYHKYLKKYPLDYETKLNCACAIYSFISASKSNTIYRIPEDERESLFCEGIKLLITIVNQDKDLTRKIKASEALVDFYVVNKDLDKAEAVAVDLPEQNGIKLGCMISIFNAKKDYDKCLELAGDVRSTAVCNYLDSLDLFARKISVFGNVRKHEAIAAWRVYEEAARYNYNLLRENKEDANDMFWHVLRSLWMRANDSIAISDIDGALCAVEDMRDFGVEYYNFRKENGADTVELNNINAWLQNSIKRCYMYSLGTPDNILDREPRFKACQQSICELK